MKIGIIEIMPVGHYTLVDSIARIYLSDPQNEIVIFTNTYGEKVLTPLVNEMTGRIKLIVKSENEKIKDFLNAIHNDILDKIYIATLEKYFNIFLHCKFNSPLILFIHNIEDWFKLGPFSLLYRFIKLFKFSKQIIYFIKVCFINPIWKKRLVNKILGNNGKLAVLNNHIKEELKQYVASTKIEVIPFSVYNPNIKDQSNNNNYIRICIPGMVDSVRRDYFSVLKIFEEERELFLNNLELEFLGGIAYKEGGEKILKQADKLIEQGIRIIYYKKDFIPLEEFDAKLSKANIILGNMNVIINKHSSYGKTKESGITYTMVRTAKPGILPAIYPVLDELRSSTLFFNTYDDLKSILRNIALDKDIINLLTKEAQKNSLYFTPSNILKTLI